jgi:hypothetical protein
VGIRSCRGTGSQHLDRTGSWVITQVDIAADSVECRNGKHQERDVQFIICHLQNLIWNAGHVHRKLGLCGINREQEGQTSEIYAIRGGGDLGQRVLKFQLIAGNNSNASTE